MIKLIALDLDGTLLNSKGEISVENLAAIKKVREEYPDIKIVFATGTGSDRAMKIAEKCQIKNGDYMVWYNGGVTVNFFDGKIKEVVKETLSFQQCQNITELAKHYNAELQIYDVRHQKVLGLDNINAFCQKALEENHQQDIINQEFLYKGLLILDTDDKTISDIMNQIKKSYPNLQVSRSKLSKSHPFYEKNPNAIGIELNSKHADKGHALAKLCAMLEIQSEEVLACGDEMNDETMLKFAGFSVAMGNAKTEIKELSMYKTVTNDQFGVAKIFEELVFSQNSSLKELKQVFSSLINHYEEEQKPLDIKSVTDEVTSESTEVMTLDK